jgi:hypothetical protein
MGTRGIFTVIYKDQEHKFFSRRDSQPWELCVDLLDLLSTFVKTWTDKEIQEFLQALNDPIQAWTSFANNDRYAGFYNAIMVEYEYIFNLDEKMLRVEGDKHTGLYDISTAEDVLQLIEEFFPDFEEDVFDDSDDEEDDLEYEYQLYTTEDSNLTSNLYL